MGIITYAVIIVLVLSVIGLGWKTMLNGTIQGFNVVVNKVPELKQLAQEAKQYLSNQSTDIVNDALAHKQGKGLRVHLTVDTNHVGQEASVGTYQYGRNVDERYNYVNNGITEITLNYQKGQIENGEFQICVRLNDGQQECGNGYNSEGKQPESVRVSIFSNGSPQPNDQSQSQSQSSNNENTNNNALSQSQETTIYICKENGCFPQ